MKSVYISGPIMAPGPDGGLPTAALVAERKNKFNLVTRRLREKAKEEHLLTIYLNPLDIEPCKNWDSADRPYCGGADSGKHSWQCYLRYDLEKLVMCDEVVMLPGWENSPGANVEKQVAEMLGLPVLYWDDDKGNALEKECEGV